MAHVDVEVRLRADSTMPAATAADAVARAASSGADVVARGLRETLPADVEGQVDRIVCDPPLRDAYRVGEGHVVPAVHVYQLHEDGGMVEDMDDDGDQSAYRLWMMPNRDFDGLWDTLVFDEDLKTQLLSFASTTLVFAEHGVNPDLIGSNRVVLLYGPPGTGKTTLCKALANKLAVRFGHRYPSASFLEVNAHSLFSKWFSESGKLVMKLFDKVHELADDDSSLVCILIDEVESLTAPRKAAMNGAEPSDAIRVVNAMLTQIDRLASKPNVLVLTTSNIVGALDLAFVDRADIKLYVGPPSVRARFEILRSCIDELMRTEVIVPRVSLLNADSLAHLQFRETDMSAPSLHLYRIAEAVDGISGRVLRKLPFVAHALGRERTYTLTHFLECLERAWSNEAQTRERFGAE